MPEQKKTSAAQALAHQPRPAPDARAQPHAHWLLVHGIRALQQRLARTWRHLPPHAGSVFVRTLAAGWAVSAAVMLAMVWLGRTYLGDETLLLLRIVDVSPVSFHAAIWVETPGNSIFLVPVMVAAAIVAVWRDMPLRALAIVAAFCMIDTLVLLGWLVWDRPRPTVIADGIAAPGFHAFPSGHVAQTITVYGLFACFWAAATPNRVERVVAVAVCSVLVIAVAFARLGLGTHWPSDIVAGAVIGGLWLAVVMHALRRAERC